MDTIRVLGSGPFADRVFYATIGKGESGYHLRLDEKIPCEIMGVKIFTNIVWFSCSGYMQEYMASGTCVETDLLYVDPNDWHKFEKVHPDLMLSRTY